MLLKKTSTDGVNAPGKLSSAFNTCAAIKVCDWKTVLGTAGVEYRGDWKLAILDCRRHFRR